MASVWASVGLAGVSGYGQPGLLCEEVEVTIRLQNVGMNRAMNFSARKMCFRALVPGFGLKKFALTLPALPIRREWPVWDTLASAEGVAGAERFAGAEGFDSVEDWGYIKQVTGGESPFCAQPVTGSHLLGYPIGRVLDLRQPHLPSRHPSWTILGDLRFSCLLLWWYTMSSGTDLPVLDQAGAAAAATNPLLGTFKGLGLDFQSDKLYDLDSVILDVLGLHAIQPRAAVVKA